MDLPQGSRGRFVAWLILLMPMFLLLDHIILPAWLGYENLTVDIDDRRFELARYRGVSANLQVYEKQKIDLLELSPLSSYLLPGASRSLAAANMQYRLQALVTKNSGKVLSTRVLNQPSGKVFEKIALDARVRLSVEGLQKVLIDLEFGQPYLFINRLNVSAKMSRSQKKDGQLEVRIQLYGLRLFSKVANTDG